MEQVTLTFLSSETSALLVCDSFIINNERGVKYLHSTILSQDLLQHCSLSLRLELRGGTFWLAVSLSVIYFAPLGSFLYVLQRHRLLHCLGQLLLVVHASDFGHVLEPFLQSVHVELLPLLPSCLQA